MTAVEIGPNSGDDRASFGAQTFLLTTRSKILVKAYERKADAVGTLLHRHGYRLFSYENGDRDCRPIDRPTYNTLALPA